MESREGEGDVAWLVMAEYQIFSSSINSDPMTFGEYDF